MDERIRRLERAAAQGDIEAERKLIRTWIALGELVPVHPARVKAIKERVNAEIETRRRYKGRRLTPAQRKAKRQRNTFSYRKNRRFKTRSK